MLELMITVSIASILLAVAVPSYQTLMSNSQLSSQANDLMATLNYARSEAVKRGQRVTVCKSANGSSCGGDWKQGWLVFTDTGTLGTVDGTDEILRVFQPIKGLSLNSNFGDWIAYLPSGRSQKKSGLSNGTFGLCDQNGSIGRNIVINNTGRPRVEKTTC